MAQQTSPEADHPPPVLEYEHHAPPTGKPNLYLGESIFACIVFPPFGVVALIHSIRARLALKQGEYARAHHHSVRAVHWGIAANVAFLLLLFAGMIGIHLLRHWI